MSRVSYAMMHDGGALEMTRAVRTALRTLVLSLANQAGLEPVDIHEIALVGNPIMHHLVLGIDPIPLGSAPFALATDRAVRIRATELGLSAHPGARVYVLPCIAGHVGADTAGVILAEAPHRATGEVRLIVDVGTNAEIVLGNADRLLAASSPTGPAFEGAQISGGQRAAPGAIERVRIDPATLEPRFKVIGSDLWSDEPGFAAAADELGVTGHLRLGHRRGRRRAVPGRCHHGGRRHRRRARGADAACRLRRPDVQLRPRRERQRRPAHHRHPERRPGDPARQGRAVRRRPFADGSPWHRDRRRDPARRRVRQPDRHHPRDDPRAHPRLRPRPCGAGRECRRDRRADRAAVGRGADRDRGRRARRSRRSRPPSSRASSSTSSRRWPSPTRRPSYPAPVGGGDAAAAIGTGRCGRGRARRATTPTRRRRRQPGWHGGSVMDDNPRRRTGGRAARQAARLAVPRRARPVPDPQARPVRGPRRGGPRTHRVQRGHDPRAGRPRVPRRRRRPPPVPRRGRRRRRASGSASRGACAGRSSRRPRHASSPSTRATPSATSRSAGCTRSSRPTTARLSCATWTAAAATAPSRTSATS